MSEESLFRQNLQSQSMLKEYEDLRREVQNRLTFQANLVTYSVVLLAAELAAVTTIQSNNLFGLLLVFAIFFLLLASLIAEHDFMIVNIAEYLLGDFKPRLDGLARSETIRWDKYLSSLSKVTVFNFILPAARYLVSALPGIGNILIYIYFKTQTNSAFTSISWSLLASSILLAVITFIRIIIVSLRYGARVKA